MYETSAAIFHGPGRPHEIRRVRVAEPLGREVLVRVLACTICGSDLHTHAGRRPAAVPTILGHEILGRIEAFGPEAARSDLAGAPLAVGDRVAWSVVASCGACEPCHDGLPQKCRRMLKYGHEIFDGRPRGGIAGHCLLAPGTALVRLPEALDDATACPASCATATVAAGFRAAGPLEGRVALVQGAGLLGLTACAMAAAAGAAEVICCEPDRARLGRAGDFGATRLTTPNDLAGAVDHATGGRGVDAAFELTGSPASFEAGLPLIRIGGRYLLIGAVFPARPASLAVETVVRRHLTLRGLHNYAPEDLLAGVRFLAANPGRPFSTQVREWFPLHAADHAFAAAATSGASRVGVRPWADA